MAPWIRNALPVLFLFLVSQAEAQRPKIENLPNFDERWYHFGFMLGFNQSGYYLDRRADPPINDTLKAMVPVDKPGFDLGIISVLHFNDQASLRFVPNLSFQERVLEYTFKGDSLDEFVEKRVNSTFINLPLNFKYRSARINNVAAYLIAGGRFSIDMASNEDVDNSVSDDIVVKMDAEDFAGQVGAGFDFFMEYFKFGIELKLSVGMKNMIINDNTRFSEPIERMRTRQLLFSLTFEG